MMPANLPVDNDNRVIAIQPDISCIVQAPAGSGKTELLVRRYLTLLADVDNPEEILAITFTNKAAAEMKHRVLTYLRSTDDQLPEELVKLVQAVRQRNKLKQWHIHHRPGRLRIMTMDGFNRLLVSQLPITSGTGIPTNIIENPADLYRQAALAAISEVENSDSPWKDSASSIIAHHNANISQVIQLLEEILSKRDQWMRYIQTNIDDYNFRNILESYWKRGLSLEINSLTNLLFDYQFWPQLCESLSFAYNIGENMLLKIWQQIPESPEDATVDHWRSLASLIFTQAKSGRSIRKKFTKAQGYPAGDKEAKIHVSHLNLFADIIRDNAQLTEILSQFPELPDAEFSEHEWQLIYATNKLLPLAVAQLRLLFRDRRATDFVEISQAASLSLGNEENPTNLALSLDSRINHLLVDEFQDTSLSQFELLEKLIAEWEPNSFRSVFLVGDPMQSIYRFRKAEVGIFLRCWNNGIGNIKLRNLSLSVNFRSNANLVNWVNQAFSTIMPNISRPAFGEVAFNPSTPYTNHEKLNNHVTVCGLCNKTAIELAQSVLNTIVDSINNHPDKTCAVLVRSRNELVDLIPLLRSQNIAYSAIEIESLDDRLVIRDLVSLTRVLLSPADDLAYLGLLRSPLCGLTLTDLTKIRNDKLTPIWSALSTLDDQQGLSADGLKRAQSLHEIILDAWLHRDNGSFRNLVEVTWNNLGGSDLCSAFDQSNVNEYFSLLSKLGKNRPNIELIVEQLAKLRATPKNLNSSVQLLTIHKAKGLEWDIVILPALHRGSAPDKDSFMMWQEIQDDDQQKMLLQAPSPTSKEKQSAQNSKHQYLKSIERKKAFQESARLLYVACTRAKVHLYLFALVQSKDGDVRKPKSNTFLNMLWPMTKQEFSVDEENINPNTAIDVPIDTANFLKRRKQFSHNKQHTSNTIQTKSSIEEIEYSWAGEIAKRMGIVIHRIIQFLALQQDSHPNIVNDTELDNWIFYLLRHQSIDQNNLQSAMQYCKKAVNNIRKDKTFHWIISSNHHKRRFEWPISHLQSGKNIHYVIDCSFIDQQNIRWIIDFKTGSHRGTDIDRFLENEVIRYSDQLQHYANAIAAMDSRPIKLGLYYPLLMGFRSWDYLP